MARGKMQSEQQLIDTEGQKLLSSVLPSDWILREYRPDYGLDYVLELFRSREEDADGPTGAETLGEHIFIQLKSERSPTPRPLSVKERPNVQKTARVTSGAGVASIVTYRYPMEMTELVTVERMGLGVPVLLVLADLTGARCSFVCLNDYIDRVLIPQHADYRSAGKRTVHVPFALDVSSDYGRRAIGWYGKRAKLLAAFHRFRYQYVELENARGSAELLPLARVFASKIDSYDFWDDESLSNQLGELREALRRFLTTGNPFEPVEGGPAKSDPAHERARLEERVLYLWRRLDLLGRTLEDVWQEWYLPTALGVETSGLSSE